nr:sensor histidine kinase [uncultured Duganella sp.]
MNHMPHLIGIDIAAAGVCALAWLALGLSLLSRRQRRRRAAQHRLIAAIGARLAHERDARAQAERALADARAQVRQLERRQQSLRDAERRRIGRDLHDDLGQQLLAMGMELGALAARHPELGAALAQVDARVAGALRALRAIVGDLRPEALDGGLRGALEQQVAQFSRLSGIACSIDGDADAIAAGARIGGGMDQVIYRILQESLSNIVRHAGASRVSVGIRAGADRLSLTVRDNGVGIGAPDPLAPPARRGAGLRGMAERVSEAGGSFDLASAPGVGTALTMSFPLA